MITIAVSSVPAVSPSVPITIMYESEEGELLSTTQLSDGRIARGLHIESPLKKFYDTHDDIYDFLFFFIPTEYSPNGAYSMPINNKVEGIGLWPTYQTMLTNRLQAKIVQETLYGLFKHAAVSNNIEEVAKGLIHEAAHRWCCYLKGFYPNPDKMISAHWPFFIDLFYGENYESLTGAAHWKKDGDTYKTVNCTFPAQRKFSNLELYLMGVLSADEVAPIDIHEFPEKPGDDIYNLVGPQCNAESPFTNTKKISIQEIVDVNGRRIPSYGESQKDFKVAFIIVVSFGQQVEDGFVDAVRQVGEVFPQAWTEATSYRSTMTINNGPPTSFFDGWNTDFLTANLIVFLDMANEVFRGVFLQEGTSIQDNNAEKRPFWTYGGSLLESAPTPYYEY